MNLVHAFLSMQAQFFSQIYHITFKGRYAVYSVILPFHREVFFEFHLKFWNTASIDIPARSLP